MGQSARSNVPCVVIIFVTNESEIKRSSPIDGMFFFNLHEISVAFYLAQRAILNYCIVCYLQDLKRS